MCSDLDTISSNRVTCQLQLREHGRGRGGGEEGGRGTDKGREGNRKEGNR